jgi:hypothetical protein
MEEGRLIGRETDVFSFAGLQELLVGLSLMEAAPGETCECTTCPMAVDKNTPLHLRDNVLVKRSKDYINVLHSERIDEKEGKQVSKNELPSRESRRCC